MRLVQKIGQAIPARHQSSGNSLSSRGW